MKPNFLPTVLIFLYKLLPFTHAIDNDEMSICPEAEETQLRNRMTKCQSLSEERFLLNPHLSGLCQYVDEFVETCTKDLELCYSVGISQRMRRVFLHMEVAALRKIVMIGDAVLDCPIVKKLEYYRIHKGNSTFPATTECESNRVKEAVNKFRSCSEDLREEMKLRFKNAIPNSGQRKNVVCNGIQRLFDECFPHLQDCFIEKALRKMKQKQLKYFATFFNPLSQRLGFSIKQCQVFWNQDLDSKPISSPLQGSKSSSAHAYFSYLSIAIAFTLHWV